MIIHEKNKVRGSNAKSSQKHVLSHNNTDNDLDIKERSARWIRWYSPEKKMRRQFYFDICRRKAFVKHLFLVVYHRCNDALQKNSSKSKH